MTGARSPLNPASERITSSVMTGTAPPGSRSRDRRTTATHTPRAAGKRHDRSMCSTPDVVAVVVVLASRPVDPGSARLPTGQQHRRTRRRPGPRRARRRAPRPRRAWPGRRRSARCAAAWRCSRPSRARSSSTIASPPGSCVAVSPQPCLRRSHRPAKVTLSRPSRSVARPRRAGAASRAAAARAGTGRPARAARRRDGPARCRRGRRTGSCERQHVAAVAPRDAERLALVQAARRDRGRRRGSRRSPAARRDRPARRGASSARSTGSGANPSSIVRRCSACSAFHWLEPRVADGVGQQPVGDDRVDAVAEQREVGVGAAGLGDHHALGVDDEAHDGRAPGR